MIPRLITPTAPLILLLRLTPLVLSQEVTTHILTQTSTVADTTITLAATSPTHTSSSYTPPQEFQRAILNSTNFYRYLHPAAYLTYNTSLAAFAQSYADQCTWRHNPEISTLGFGENLAKGYSTPSAAVDAWGTEALLFDFTDDDEYTGFTEATGHFTQLVWRSTTSVGCAWTDCTSSSSGREGDIDGVFLVCNYFPAGNIMAPDSDGSDEYRFFKQNIVPERVGGSEGFDAEEAGQGVGGPTGSATESVVGTVTANAAAGQLLLRQTTAGRGWNGVMGSLAAVGLGMVVGGGSYAVMN